MTQRASDVSRSGIGSGFSLNDLPRGFVIVLLAAASWALVLPFVWLIAAAF